MPTIQEQLEKLKGKLPSYTPEQLEAARRKVAQENSICSLDCPECKGAGYLKGEDGKVYICPNVDPFKIYTPERFGLEGDERALNWSAIEPTNNTPAAVEAVLRCLERGHGWVYLWGDYGVGKTLILKAVVAQALQSHKMAAFVRMAEILDNLRDGFSQQDPSEQAQARLDWWSGLPILAIDEFNRVNNTEWATERRFLLMDRRYQQAIREQSITVIASNTDPSKLEGYLYDRIQDGRFEIVQVSGHSYRPGAEWGQP